MKTSTFLAIISVVIPAVAAITVGLRQGRSSDKTGMAAQYTALADRLRTAEARMDDLQAKLDASERREAEEHRNTEKWRQVSVALWAVIVQNDHLEIPPWVEAQLAEAGMVK